MEDGQEVVVEVMEDGPVVAVDGHQVEEVVMEDGPVEVVATGVVSKFTKSFPVEVAMAAVDGHQAVEVAVGHQVAGIRQTSRHKQKQ